MSFIPKDELMNIIKIDFRNCNLFDRLIAPLIYSAPYLYGFNRLILSIVNFSKVYFGSKYETNFSPRGSSNVY